MGTIKVTFYNNNSLAVNNIPSDNSGIYFQPSADINKNLPAHIVHYGHFYTYGSYVIDEKLSENIDYTDSYVITNIVSDQYAKTLTVHKQKLDLSGLENKIKTVESNFNTLCGSSYSLQLGNDYTITIYVDENYTFKLSSTPRTTPSCKIKLNNGAWADTTISHNLSTTQATISFGEITSGAKINSITISSDTFNDTTTLNNLFTVNKNNNTITIKNVGWADTLLNSYSFNIIVNLGPQDGITDINTVDKKFICTLNKISSTATPTTQTLNLNENKQTISTLTILKNITPSNANISYTVNTDKLLIANNELKFNNGISTYSFTGNTNFILTYNISTRNDDIYYNTSGTINGTITASKWTVKFNSRGTTVKTSDGYYNGSVTFPTNPSNYTENNYTYTFDGWKDSNGNKYTTLKFGQTGVNFDTTHTLTLTASFNATQQTKYYWYVGQDNPASIDTANLKTATNEAGWHLIGTSTSGFTLTFNNQNYIEFNEKTQYYLTIPNLLSVYAADGSTPVEDKYFVTTEQKITGYKTLLYNTSVWEVKGLVIK